MSCWISLVRGHVTTDDYWGGYAHAWWSRQQQPGSPSGAQSSSSGRGHHLLGAMGTVATTSTLSPRRCTATVASMGAPAMPVVLYELGHRHPRPPHSTKVGSPQLQTGHPSTVLCGTGTQPVVL
jgi:hypothetical protein